MTQAGTSFYSPQTYYPYGTQRTTEGSGLPTDYTFTGQKNDDSTGLMFYSARYYDTALGRFTQPDTIVPSNDPQNLNRYSYVHNNPVNFIDPTGHDEGNCEQQNGDCDRYFHAQGLCWSMNTEEYSRPCAATVDSQSDLARLSLEHPELLTNPALMLAFGPITSQNIRVGILQNVGFGLASQRRGEFEILLGLATLDAKMTGNNPLWFVDDLAVAILGWHAGQADSCGLTQGRFCSIDRRRLAERLAQVNTAEIGFASQYQDPTSTSSQVNHFWEYVAISYSVGPEYSLIGNGLHELTGNPPIGQGGGSWPDFYLGQKGTALGTLLRLGVISPAQTPDWIYRNLSADVVDLANYPH